jgi:tRNA dimethylallyltransferase
LEIIRMKALSKECPTLAVVLGPTASGKSSLAIWLARQVGGEVVACDSTQVYRGFTVGTGKTLPGEQQGVPHHLMDVADANEVFTAGEYRRRALEVLAKIWQHRNLPIFTVGTGLYLRALLEGFANTPQRSESLRERLRQDAVRHGSSYLHRMLGKLDCTAASRIEPADTQKLIRALEICLLSGKTATEVLQSPRQKLEGVRVKKIGLLPPRDELYARIDQRVHRMIESGWIEEVRNIQASGISPSSKPFTFIGYSQLQEHIRGEMKLAETIGEIQQATRHYAKRQFTWFRKEPDVCWLPGFGDSPKIMERALPLLRKQ